MGDLAKIQELENLASEVLSLKRLSIPRRPIVIEFCGSPKSGKSTCINSLALFLKRNKFKTLVLSEKAAICPIGNKRDPYFNIWTVSSTIADLSVNLSEHAKEYDIILIDRGIFDSLCWFTWLYENQHLVRKEFSALKSYLLLERWRSAIDLIFIFTADTSASLQREFANLLTRKTGSIMKREVLQDYKNVLDDCSRKYKKFFKKIKKFDTTDIDLNRSNYLISKEILEILKSSAQEKIGFFPVSSMPDHVITCFSFSEADFNTNGIRFDRRDKIEDDMSLVQPIPLLILIDQQRESIFCVKKNDKSTSSSSPEKGKTLLYLGGHVREEDGLSADVDSVEDVICNALRREVKEEVGFDFAPNRNMGHCMCIWDRSNPKSAKHLAICFIKYVNSDEIKLKLDANEFMKKSNKNGAFVEYSDLKDEYSNLESWSMLIMKNILNINPKQGDLLNFLRPVEKTYEKT